MFYVARIHCSSVRQSVHAAARVGWQLEHKRRRGDGSIRLFLDHTGAALSVWPDGREKIVGNLFQDGFGVGDTVIAVAEWRNSDSRGRRIFLFFSVNKIRCKKPIVLKSVDDAGDARTLRPIILTNNVCRAEPKWKII